MFLKKSIILPNGIDCFWHKNKTGPRILNNGQSIKLLTVGEISQNKNQLATAQAIELLIKEGVEVVYLVVGKISILESQYVQ